MNMGPSSSQPVCRPCEPLTSDASSGITSSSERKPALRFSELPADRQRRDPDGGIEEQLHRVVAGLAMDIDRAREVRRAPIVQPEVVREPRLGLGDRDQIAGPRVADVMRALAGAVEHRLDAGSPFDDGADRVGLRRVVDVHVRDLVIGHRERGARAGVEHLAAQLLAHGNQPCSRSTRLRWTGEDTSRIRTPRGR